MSYQVADNAEHHTGPAPRAAMAWRRTLFMLTAPHTTRRRPKVKLNDLPTNNAWTLARRAERMNPSVIREILKVTEKPGIISFGGGLPSPKTFPYRPSLPKPAPPCWPTTAPPPCSTPPAKALRPLRQAVADFLPWDVDPTRC
jgi:2-aminoadipate transaminase